MNIGKKSRLSLKLNNESYPWPLKNDKCLKRDYFWPKISIVTPSYNHARFVEETILSILEQGYPNLEYIIIDGGSTDGSLNIIKKYKKYINYWISEPDNGQSNAINKGIKLASGDIVGWINSDDLLMPYSLWKIGFFFTTLNILACSGNDVRIDEHSEIICYRRMLPLDTKWLLAIGKFSQPTFFWKRNLVNKIGLLNENFHYAMDYDYFLRLSTITSIYHIDEYIAAYRFHKGQKTINNKIEGINESSKISQPYIKELFQTNKAFQYYSNYCRIKELFWYLQTRQFRRISHPIKRIIYYRNNWRK